MSTGGSIIREHVAQIFVDIHRKGTYDDYFSASDVCESCAVEEISPDFGTGGEDMENAASHWDD